MSMFDWGFKRYSADSYPTSASVNDIIIDSDTRRFYYWDGSEWVFLNGYDTHADNWRVVGLAYLREERSKRLLASDWTQAADVPLSDDKRAEWAEYRQALRDLPETVDDPWGFGIFPESPA